MRGNVEIRLIGRNSWLGRFSVGGDFNNVRGRGQWRIVQHSIAILKSIAHEPTDSSQICISFLGSEDKLQKNQASELKLICERQLTNNDSDSVRTSSFVSQPSPSLSCLRIDQYHIITYIMARIHAQFEEPFYSWH